MKNRNIEIIHHIAHGVEIQIQNWLNDYVGIKKGEVIGCYFLDGLLHLEYVGGHAGKSLNICKLMLRPLSELTNEIEINGQKFVPFQLIGKAFPDIIPLLFEAINEKRNIETLPYQIIEFLLSWHFDIFGLIPAGLAVKLKIHRRVENKN